MPVGAVVWLAGSWPLNRLSPCCNASPGKLRRSGMHGYKQSDFKKVYVRIAEEGGAPVVGSPKP